MTRYYTESGTPPGYWLGSGLDGLGDGTQIIEGSEVTEEQLFRLLGMLQDPVTGEPLGRRPANWPTPLNERIKLRLAALPTDLSTAERADRVRKIESEEHEREKHISRPVAGFDLTFSVPKSISTVWAITDAKTQEIIHQAHRDAIKTVLAYAEKNILLTRTGAAGSVQLPIRGVIAAAFDHWESRSGDPHLHTHVVIANRVQGPDGQWRSLDARVLYAYVVALSEMHEGVVQDVLSDRLGYAWEERVRKHSAVPRWEIAGVPQALIDEFSSRSRDIETPRTSSWPSLPTSTDASPRAMRYCGCDSRPPCRLAPQRSITSWLSRPRCGGSVRALSSVATPSRRPLISPTETCYRR
jgi:conjugative relaxase-like TrwC/TraI family protein